VVEDYFEEYLKLNPMIATAIGDDRYNDRLPNPNSKKFNADTMSLIDSSLKKIKAIPKASLNEHDLLTYEIFIDELETLKKLKKVSLETALPFNQFMSFFSDFAEVASGSSYVPFRNTKDYQDFLKRMDQIPATIDGMIADMKVGMNKGVVNPEVITLKAVKQAEDLLVKDPAQSVFMKSLSHFPDAVPSDERQAITALYADSVTKKIYPAYQKLIHFIKVDYLPRTRKTHGIDGVPGGSAYYKALIRFHTTTNLSADQIHKIGLKEVKRIRQDLEKAKTALGFKGDLLAFFKSLRDDPKLYPFKTADEVMKAYHGIHAKLLSKVPTLFKRAPKAGFEIREIEKFRAESASEGYQNPSADGSRPGIFWVPIPDATKYGSKSMEPLFLHEAIPGHHFQIAISQELDLPRFRKFGGNNAYVEGWGLYSESLGKELGLYTDLHSWVGRLEGEMHRAIRLVVDTGIHTKGWTREKAIQYSLENEPVDEAGAISEIERYMVIPGQALSYKIGELKIRELREKLSKKQGAAFDVREFHDQILKDGALPLSILEQKILN
jgi:uncharacterized protein (DUF885 family)